MPEEGRDCWFQGILCGLGAKVGTRLLVFGETRVVSVLEEGRDCWFQGILCGLGAEEGTRLQVSGESVRSRCQSRDETAGFRGFRAVSVLKEGRDC